MAIGDEMREMALSGAFGPSARERAMRAMGAGGLGTGGDAKDTVRHYLHLMDVLYSTIEECDRMLASASPSDRHLIEEQRSSGSLLWSRLRQARIFSMEPGVYAESTRLAAMHVVQNVAGVSWPPKDFAMDEIAKVFNECSRQERWMDHLPFEVTWIGFGNGIQVPKQWIDMRGIGDHVPRGASVFTLGVLVSDADRRVWESCACIGHNGHVSYFNMELCINGVWSGWPIGQWAIPMLIDLINEHRSTVIKHKPSREDRRNWKSAGKKMRVRQLVPRPYYEVKLKRRVIGESLQKYAKARIRKKHVLTHRHDVRGHECCKIVTGKLPVPAKEEKKLLKRGYRIYTQMQDIKPDDLDRMMKRGIHSLGHDEWVAIKSWWRDQFVRGPKGAPYIPAVRSVKPSQRR